MQIICSKPSSPTVTASHLLLHLLHLHLWCPQYPQCTGGQDESLTVNWEPAKLIWCFYVLWLFIQINCSGQRQTTTGLVHLNDRSSAHLIPEYILSLSGCFLRFSTWQDYRETRVKLQPVGTRHLFSCAGVSVCVWLHSFTWNKWYSDFEAF